MRALVRALRAAVEVARRPQQIARSARSSTPVPTTETSAPSLVSFWPPAVSANAPSDRPVTMCVACAQGPSRGMSSTSASSQAQLAGDRGLHRQLAGALQLGLQRRGAERQLREQLVGVVDLQRIGRGRRLLPVVLAGFTRHSGSRRMLQPEYATATVPLRSKHLQVRLLGRGPLGHQRARLAGGDAAPRLLGRDVRQHAAGLRRRRLHAARAPARATAPRPPTCQRSCSARRPSNRAHVFMATASQRSDGARERVIGLIRTADPADAALAVDDERDRQLRHAQPAGQHVARVVNDGERQVVVHHRLARGVARLVERARRRSTAAARAGAAPPAPAACAGRGDSRRRRNR